METTQPQSDRTPSPRAIFAVVVTMNRPTDLRRLLGLLIAQTRPLAGIVVVDNGGLPETRAVAAEHHAVTFVPSRRNLGGAGGFVLGIMQALAMGADRIWLMDDDGYPETPDCLRLLADVLEKQGYALVSPIILDIDDSAKLAFYYYANGRPLIRREQLKGREVFPQFAHLFNGALVRAEAFERYGLPRYELFFRGDETDFLFRLNRLGARFATMCNVAFLHPSGARDTVPIMGGRYHAVIPASRTARYYYYRNRGNLFREFRLGRAAFYDLVRYGWAFLITGGGDWHGFADWARTVGRGWRRDFTAAPTCQRSHRPPGAP